MTEQVVQEVRQSEQTIRRADLSQEPFTAEHRVALDRLLTERWKREAAERAEINELRRRALSPVERLIREDSAATEAAVELHHRALAQLEQVMDIRLPGFGEAGISLIPRLSRGLNLFSHPYDFVVLEDGGRPADVTLAADRFTGVCEFSLALGREHARFATAGVGLALEAGATGVAHVRPAWSYEYGYRASGNWLGSHTEGAARVVVQDAATRAVLKEATAASPRWNVDNDDDANDNGWVNSWALNLDFFVEAGQVFIVTCLTTGMVDDSGEGDWPGAFSLAWAHMRTDLHFVVVELGP